MAGCSPDQDYVPGMNCRYVSVNDGLDINMDSLECVAYGEEEERLIGTYVLSCATWFNRVRISFNKRPTNVTKFIKDSDPSYRDFHTPPEQLFKRC